MKLSKQQAEILWDCLEDEKVEELLYFGGINWELHKKDFPYINQWRTALLRAWADALEGKEEGSRGY